MKKRFLLIVVLGIILTSFIVCPAYYERAIKDDKILSYVVDPKTQYIRFYWKDDNLRIFRSIQNLKNWLEDKHETLVFATNGGMYKPDNSPQGLFIQDKKELVPLDTSSGTGNFYLKPNGVFYITSENKAAICETGKFASNGDIKYATQSGPMLVINGAIHPVFKKGSTHLNIRNGVGILPNNKVIFAMSKQEINLYDFATYFKDLGCQNALYLDGFVSRTYLPEQNWVQLDGNFGVMIGVTKK
jgi:uncharacterized protein YigE (DUF2233 family)